MEREDRSSNTAWNRFWNRIRDQIGCRKLYCRRNKGFSLVELIIVIAIMAILAAAIAPAVIRYINKARQADDIAAADSLGSTLNAAITSNEAAYSYISKCVYWIEEGGKKSGRDGWMRVVCFMNAGYQMSGWGNVSGGNAGNFVEVGTLTAEEQAGREEIKKVLVDLMGQSIFKLKFTRNIYMDQWIICIDKNYQFHIFAGGGINNYVNFVYANHISSSSHHNRVYQLWPESDAEYHVLSSPPDEWITQ